jgi:hypothetical protein
MTMDERRLEECYRDLAAGDERRAPSFGSVLVRDRRARGARIPVLALFGVAAAVALLVALPIGRKGDVSVRWEPAPPLEFLLRAPAQDRLAGVPVFDLDPRDELSRSIPPGLE